MSELVKSKEDTKKENRARSVGDKHLEIMMRWVDAQETGGQTQEFWDELQKEYRDFENEVYAKYRK